MTPLRLVPASVRDGAEPLERRFGGTAFVLAGGGSHGAVQVGMLRALLAAGVRPDFVVGTSVGAINGVFLAGDPTPEGVERLSRVWIGLTRHEIYPNFALGWVRSLLRGRAHVVDPRGLRRILAGNLPMSRLEQGAVPACVVTADLRDGSEVVLSHGDAVDAILASAAIPGIFPPAHIDGRMLIDGALAKNAAISTAVALGAARVIVLPTGFGCAVKSPPRSVIAMAVQVVSLLLARQLADEAERFAPLLPIAVVPPLCPLGVSSFDFSHSRRLIADAAESTEQWIAGGGLQVRTIPMTLAPHTH